MFVNVKIQQTPAHQNPLAIPASAVIDTGRRKIAFVEITSGVFRPREVSLGQVSGDYYPVLGGLKAGDKVATSGGFLLDANAEIQTGGGNMAGMSMPAPGAKQQPAPAGSTDMGNMPGMAMPPNDAGKK
jgi:Cu(I)/Ag(I) efflux system membrane fusion protein